MVVADGEDDALEERSSEMDTPQKQRAVGSLYCNSPYSWIQQPSFTDFQDGEGEN